MEEKIDVFVCPHCGYEDSSFIPSGARLKDSLECEAGYVQCPECKEVVTLNIVKMNMGKDMTMREYLELVAFIDENHSFRAMKGKHIKYISHTYDFRSCMIHRIIIGNREFAKVNENRHRNLKEWVYNYLNNPDII